MEHGEALQRLCRCEHPPPSPPLLLSALQLLPASPPSAISSAFPFPPTPNSRRSSVKFLPPLTLDPLLAQLDEALDELYKGEEDVQLPEFPEKKLFGSLSPALIKERQAGLEKYMKAIALDEHVMQARVLREFLETPDTKA